MSAASTSCFEQPNSSLPSTSVKQPFGKWNLEREMAFT